jgi:lysophospholipase L1-like esterase
VLATFDVAPFGHRRRKAIQVMRSAQVCTKDWISAMIALMIGGSVMTGAVPRRAAGSAALHNSSGAPGAKPDSPLRIMCVGDSITAGYTDNPKWNVPFEFGYRGALYTRLTNAGYRVQFVGESPEPWDGRFGKPRNTPSPDLRAIGQDHHRGYGGWGTSGILGDIGKWVSADKPDVVLLMIGINDGGSPAARTNLDSIVRKIVDTNPDVYVIVAQITPTVLLSQAIVDYNTYIRDRLVPAFQTSGKHVRTVNQCTNLLTDGSIDPKLFSNGINHPNAVAYDRMAQSWCDAIMATYPRPANR